MTWAWSIPGKVEPRVQLLAPPLRPERTRVIVPTYRDWQATRVTVESLLDCRPGPAEIVVVSDNPNGYRPEWTHRYAIHVHGCGANLGPSVARNLGAGLITTTELDWLVFTDAGCQRSPDFFAALSAHSHSQSPGCVAIAGPVRGVVTTPSATPINHYMTVEQILHPPRRDGEVQAIVTANAAVYRAAFCAAGGFDPSYPFAAGEDLDLGLKLRNFGRISWAPGAVVWHRFKESRLDFERRFERYGDGNAHLEHRWHLPSMRAQPFVAHEQAQQYLADLQVSAMQRGYDRYWARVRRRLSVDDLSA